jgi:hypothetical protein
MPFTAGDTVHLRGLGTGIVRAIRSGGRVTVEIKGRTLVVDEGQLESHSGGGPKGPPYSGRRQRPSAATEPRERSAPAKRRVRERVGESEGRGPSDEIDLHGYTVEEAVAALDAFINDALLASASEVRIIHGRSGGRIKQAVHARLRDLLPVSSFRLDPRNPGVTIVSL